MTIGKLIRVVAVASILSAGAAAPAWPHGTGVTIQSGADTATQTAGVIREDAFLDENGPALGRRSESHRIAQSLSR